MKSSTEDHIEGAIHEVRGVIKETVGQVTRNSDLEAEGQDERLAGKLQRKVAEVKELFET